MAKRIFGGLSFPLAHGIRAYTGTSVKVQSPSGDFLATLLVVVLALYLAANHVEWGGVAIIGLYVVLRIGAAAHRAWNRYR